MAFTKMTQHAYSLTLGGADRPGFLKIMNGKFEMVSGVDGNYDVKISGTRIEMANGTIVLDAKTKKITVGGSIVLDGNQNTIDIGSGAIVMDASAKKIAIGNILIDSINNRMTFGGMNLIIDAGNRRLLVNDGTHDRVIIGRLI